MLKKYLLNPLLHLFHLFTPTIKNFNIPNHLTNKNTYSILIICTFTAKSGGIINYVLEFYKLLNNHRKQPAILLIPATSQLLPDLKKLQLPYITIKSAPIFKFFKLYNHPFLNFFLKETINKLKIKIAYCNKTQDYRILPTHPKIKKLLIRHFDAAVPCHYDGALYVSRQKLNKFKRQNKKVKTFYFHPFLNPHEIEKSKKGKLSPQQFFSKELKFDVKNATIITIVAALTNVKNQTVAIRAVEHLIKKEGLNVKLILCGDGYNQKKLKRLAQRLQIKEHLLFTGFTSRRLEIVAHSHIKLLTSKKEGCPISLIEAALLGKCLVGPQDTGVENIIIDKQTGLLFKQNDHIDLAQKLAILIKDVPLQKRLSANSYKYALKNFACPQTKIKQLEKIETALLS